MCANQYRLSWDEAHPGSRGLQDGQHCRGPPEVEQPAPVGGNVLVVAGAKTEDVAQFIVRPAVSGGAIVYHLAGRGSKVIGPDLSDTKSGVSSGNTHLFSSAS